MPELKEEDRAGVLDAVAFVGAVVLPWASLLWLKSVHLMLLGSLCWFYFYAGLPQWRRNWLMKLVTGIHVVVTGFWVAVWATGWSEFS